MVLDISGGLFNTGGLQQETGLLKERWGQGGSNVVNVAGSGSYTVTAGKILFITGMTYFGRSAADDIILKDGGSGGTTKYWGQVQAASADEIVTVAFTTPLKFLTSVYVDDGSANAIISWTGWEE